MKKYLMLIMPVLTFSCISNERKVDPASEVVNDIKKFALYSNSVRDSFMISTYMPDTSIVKIPTGFPVIFVLDANLYFEIYASILKKYSEVGLLPPAILVGIGYSSFEKMDSLRQRDYTFPEGLPEYEMPVSGKADLFLDFIEKELIPEIDQKFPTDSSKRILMGHSLGGYFALYAQLRQLRENSDQLMGFIAASPSVHFNHNYLLKQYDSLPNFAGIQKKSYIAFGGLENPEMLTSTNLTVNGILKKLSISFSRISGNKLKTVNFSDMEHMDTQIPAFLKGIQWITSE